MGLAALYYWTKNRMPIEIDMHVVSNTCIQEAPTGERYSGLAFCLNVYMKVYRNNILSKTKMYFNIEQYKLAVKFTW